MRAAVMLGAISLCACATLIGVTDDPVEMEPPTEAGADVTVDAETDAAMDASGDARDGGDPDATDAGDEPEPI